MQEIKATPEQLDESVLNPLGFHSFWHPAQKPGYSGVAIYSHQEPTEVRTGLGQAEFDQEGRVLTAEFGDLAVISAYFPNSQREHTRLPYKLQFCDAMLAYCKSLEALQRCTNIED